MNIRIINLRLKRKIQNHRIYINNKGWIEAKDILENDEDLSKFIGCHYNEYDLHKFKDTNNKL